MSAIGDGARRVGGRGLPGVQRAAVLRERCRQHDRGGPRRGQHASAAWRRAGSSCCCRPSRRWSPGSRKARTATRLSRTRTPREKAAGRSGQLALLKAYAAAAARARGRGDRRAPGCCARSSALAKQAAVVVCEASADVIRALEVEHGVRFDRDAAELLRQMAGGRRRPASGGRRAGAAVRGGTEDDHPRSGRRGDRAGGVGRRQEAVERGGRPPTRPRRSGNCGLELAEGAVPFMVLGLLRSVVERTVAARDLPRALDALLRTDLALKTSGGDPRVLLERLVVELCATAGRGRDAAGAERRSPPLLSSSPLLRQLAQLAGSATCTGRRRCRG